MSLFGRIKSAVVGNPVTKEYELGRHIASAGPGLMWKVYSATKKTTRQVYKMYMYITLCIIIFYPLSYFCTMYMYSTCIVHVPFLTTCCMSVYTVVFWLSTHGCLNITCDFGRHRRLSRIYMIVTSIRLYRSCYIDPLKRATCTWALLPGTLRYMYRCTCRDLIKNANLYVLLDRSFINS